MRRLHRIALGLPGESVAGLFVCLAFTACVGSGGTQPGETEPAPAGPLREVTGEPVVTVDPQPTGDAGAASSAVLFVVGGDGRLRPREVELPPLSGNRDRAEALVRRVVADSGTFPEGVQVLDVFVSGRGVAVVNFTLDLLERHSGGLAAEELTVYSLSHTLVESVPAIAEVILIVEGQQTETLAGHLDLRSGFGRAPARLLAPA